MNLIFVLLSALVLQDWGAKRERLSSIELKPSLAQAIVALEAEASSAYCAGVGDPTVQRTDLAKRKDFKRWYTEGLERFSKEVIEKIVAATERGPTPATLAELFLHQRGGETFRDAWKEDPSIRPEDLLTLLDMQWLSDTPLHESEGWKRLHDYLDRYPVAPAQSVSLLGNSVARYLIWGAINTASYWAQWEDGGSRKDAFISELLYRGTTDPVLAELIKVSFEPPLAVALGPSPTKAWRMPAGHVGYSAEHLKLAEDLCLYLSYAEPPSLPTDPNSSYARRAEAGWEERYASEMHRRILKELDPENDAPLLGGTTAQQLGYWQELARLGRVNFWNKAKPHLLNLLLGKIPHPLDADLARLEVIFGPSREMLDARERGEAYHLTPEVIAAYEEWQRLSAQKHREQLRVATALVDTLATFSSEATDEVAAEFRAIEGFLESNRKAHVAPTLLRSAWLDLAMRNGRWSGDTLKGYVEGEVKLSPLASEQVILGVRESLHPEHGSSSDDTVRASLAILGRNGTDDQRYTVLQDASSFDEATINSLFGTAIDDYLSSCKPGSDPRRCLGEGVVRGLLWQARAEKDPTKPSGWIYARVLQSFEQGLWNAAGSSCIGYGNNGDAQRWAVKLLSAADFARLKEADKIPSEMFPLRD